jgi:hypothetical protein
MSLVDGDLDPISAATVGRLQRLRTLGTRIRPGSSGGPDGQGLVVVNGIGVYWYTSSDLGEQRFHARPAGSVAVNGEPLTPRDLLVGRGQTTLARPLFGRLSDPGHVVRSQGDRPSTRALPRPQEGPSDAASTGQGSSHVRVRRAGRRRHVLAGAQRGVPGPGHAQLLGRVLRGSGRAAGTGTGRGGACGLYNFADGEVARHIPWVWGKTTPQEAIAVRERGSTAALRQVIGGLADAPGLVRVADLATRAALSAPTEGRVLYAGPRPPARPPSRAGRCPGSPAPCRRRRHRG